MNSQVSRVWTFDFEPAQVQRFKVALTLRSKGLDVWTGHLHHPPSCFLFCRLSFVLVWFSFSLHKQTLKTKFRSTRRINRALETGDWRSDANSTFFDRIEIELCGNRHQDFRLQMFARRLTALKTRRTKIRDFMPGDFMPGENGINQSVPPPWYWYWYLYMQYA